MSGRRARWLLAVSLPLLASCSSEPGAEQPTAFGDADRPDNFPPDTSIDSGPEGEVAQASADFTFSCTETACSFECNLDRTGFESCTSPVHYDALADGLHRLEVRAIDATYNIDPTPARRDWRVVTTTVGQPPETYVDRGPEGVVATATASFSLRCDRSSCLFICSFDGDPPTACDAEVVVAGLAEGVHTFSAQAIDDEGRTDPTPSSRTWTVDTVAPDTQIVGGPVSRVTSTRATFELGCDESACAFSCVLDGGPPEPCATPVTLVDLSSAGHTLQVSALDAAGNQDATPASWFWTIDVDPPHVQLEVANGQSDPTGSTPIAFEVTFDEPIIVASFTVADVTDDGTAGVTGWTLSDQGDATSFLLEATGVSGAGTVQPRLAAGVVQDLAGNGNLASTSIDNTVLYDLPGPDVTINRAAAQSAVTNTTPILFDVVFDEPIDPASFTPGDVTNQGTASVTAWSIANSGDDQGFTLSATTISTDGTVIPSLAAGVVTNPGGDPSSASTSTDVTVAYDTVGPAVVLGLDSSQPDTTSALPIVYEVTFDQPVDAASFSPSDVTQTGSATNVVWSISQIDPQTFRLEATDLDPGGIVTVIPFIPAGAVQDAAGNDSSASTSSDDTVTYETPPTLRWTVTTESYGTVASDLLRVVTLENLGATAAGTVQVTLGGSDASRFVVGTDNCSGAALAAASSCTVEVTFLGGSQLAGTYIATLQADGTPGGTSILQLAGAVACPTTPTSFDTATPGTPLVVPGGCTTLTVKIWGAGGGGRGADGAAGGYATGVVDVTPGETLTVLVGGAGTRGGTGGTNGGGAGGWGAYCDAGASMGGGGGGYSAVYRGAGPLMIAGGGGGSGGFSDSGGGGGGSTGGNGGSGADDGGGGTQFVGGAGGLGQLGGDNGTAGTAYQGGNGGDHTSGGAGLCIGGGGGGGGRYGGGGGGGAAGAAGAGGGGSGYAASSGITGATLTTATAATPPATTDPDYAAPAGEGGLDADGEDGLVIVIPGDA